MKKTIGFVLTILLCTIVLAACGKSEANKPAETSANAQSTSQSGANEAEASTAQETQQQQAPEPGEPEPPAGKMSIEDMNHVLDRYSNQNWRIPGDDASYIEFMGENGSYVLWTSFHNYYDKGELYNYDESSGQVTVNDEGYLVAEIPYYEGGSIVYVFKDGEIEATYGDFTATFKPQE